MLRNVINNPIKTVILTGMALVAFAANSVLCRLALGEGAIDASSFTTIRLLSGALALFVIISIANDRRSQDITSKGSWLASLMLFIYAATFSYAYLSLDTGTGALILFGSVQITMILLTVIGGTRIEVAEWAGLCIAFAGFIYLILPGVSAPSMRGFILMTLAGVAWGSYTLLGQRSENPLLDTSYNFFRTVPLVVLLTLLTLKQASLSTEGIVLALTSGVITSGIGYTIWYIVLRNLSSTQAAVLQLSVPVIAAGGGVLFVFEAITPRLLIASILVLGGILMVIMGKPTIKRT
jgi:Predicted permease, DMT superfamily